MNVKPTTIDGLLELTPNVFPDHRGRFLELYKDSVLAKIHPSIKFVQENLSFSKKGVIRGLHLQLPPAQQAKLITVVHGKILDVVVDLRKGSPHFAQVYTLVLNSNKHNMLLIPEGFAHGFIALEDSLLLYRCSSEYNPGYETGIRWNDPQLNIKWGTDEPILSEKDKKLPTLEELLDRSVIIRQ